MSNSVLSGGVFCVASAVFTVLTSIDHGQAQDSTSRPLGFRVETDIFAGNEAKPAQQSLSLFSESRVIDVSFAEPDQITIVDFANNKITLAHLGLKQKTAIDTGELMRYLESARAQAANSELLSVSLAGADKITREGQRVAVGDDALRYVATLQQPPNQQMADSYARAADALALLNGWRTGIPPFARLRLNRFIAEQKSLPEEISRLTQRDSQTDTVRCRLHTNWQLSSDDQRRIAEIDRSLGSCKTVLPHEYFAANAQLANNTESATAPR